MGKDHLNTLNFNITPIKNRVKIFYLIILSIFASK